MARLINTVESLGGTRKAEDYRPHGTTLGELLFPGRKNHTGLMLDRISKGR